MSSRCAGKSDIRSLEGVLTYSSPDSAHRPQAGRNRSRNGRHFSDMLWIWRRIGTPSPELTERLKGSPVHVYAHFWQIRSPGGCSCRPSCAPAQTFLSSPCPFRAQPGSGGGHRSQPVRGRSCHQPTIDMKSDRNTIPTMLFFIVFTIAGCSTKTFYEATRAMAENNCRRQPPSEAESCVARLNKMSYEEYERKRSGQNL